MRLPSLSRDAAALAVSSAVTSALGFVFWIAATRLYPVNAVGVATSVIAAATTLAALANLSFGQLYQRFLPVAGSLTTRLIVSGTGATIVLAAAGGAIFTVVGPREELFPTPPEAIFFVVVTVILAGFTLWDSILIAVHRSTWTAAKNITHAVLKLLIIVALAPLATASALVAGWVAPALLLLLVVAAALWYRRSAIMPPSQPALPATKEIVEYGGVSLGWMIGQNVPGLLIPVLVVSILGVAEAAYFNIAWTIVSASLVLMSLVTAPFVSSTARPGADIAAATRSLIRVIAVVSVLRGVGVGVIGPVLLFVYGADYAAEGAGLLMIMGVVHLISGVGYLYGALARLYRKIVYPMVVQLAGAALLIILTAIWLPMFGIAGAGWAFLAHDIAVLLAALPPLIGLLRRARQGLR